MFSANAPMLLKKRLAFVVITAMFCFCGGHAMALDGLIILKSDSAPAETLARLDAAITANNMTVFAKIDHSAAAASVGMTLRPTTVVIFGGPKGGTPLMQSAQTMGIDLPLRALVWQDASGDTWLSYNDVRWLASRHGAGADVQVNLQRLSTALETVATAATGTQVNSKNTKR